MRSSPGNIRSDFIAAPRTGDYRADSCNHRTIETCEHFAGPPQSRRRQSIETPTRPACAGGIDGLPAANEPPCRLETNENGIQGSGGEPTTLMYFGTRKLLGRILEESFEH